MREFGTIRKLPSGRWQARYCHPASGDRITAPSTFERKADASRWLATVEADLARGLWVEAGSAAAVRLADWAEEWLARDPNKRASTLVRDRQALAHFLPDLGTRTLTEITPHDIQRTVARIVAVQAPATVRRNVAVLSGMFNAAVELELIGRSPVRGLKLPRVTAKAHPHLDADDLRRLVDAVPPRYGALVLTAGVLGLRWGELAGLQIADVDLEHGAVRVCRQLVELRGSLSLQPPKTSHGVRTLAAPPVVLEALTEHIRRFRPDAGPMDPLFISPRGAHIRRNFVARTLRPAAVGIGLSAAVTAHGLRHVATTLMVEVGEHPKVMQRRLGHADPRMTLAVYAHASDDADRAAARRLEGLFVERSLASST